MTPFEAFQTYQAVRLHFHGNFDYFKYNGKTSLTEDAFNIRKDKYAYHKAIREIDNNNMHYYFAVNFLMRDKTYIKNMFDFEAQDNFINWSDRQSKRSSLFEQDLGFATKQKPYKELIVCENHNYPRLFVMYMQKDIRLETLYILDHYLGIFDIWDRELNQDFIWQKEYLRIKKFATFFWNWAPPNDSIYKNIIKKYLVN